LVSPEVFWLDFAHTKATLIGLAASAGSIAIADAAKAAIAKTIIFPPLMKYIFWLCLFVFG
jgi:hypothetical protein